MEAGKLNHYVTLQNKTNVVASTRGWPVGSGSGDMWQDVYVGLPAEVITLGGREAELARQIVASADSRVRLRYVDGVTPGQSRFVWNSRVFNVNWKNNVGQQNKELICLCTEVIGVPQMQMQSLAVEPVQHVEPEANVSINVTLNGESVRVNSHKELFKKVFGGSECSTNR